MILLEALGRASVTRHKIQNCKKIRHFSVKNFDIYRKTVLFLMSFFVTSTKFAIQKSKSICFGMSLTSDRRVELASGNRARYCHLDKS